MYNFEILFYLTHLIFIMSTLLFLNNKNNILIMFIATELLSLAGFFNYLFFFYFFQHCSGEALMLIFFGLGAGEAAIGLVLIVNFVKLQNILAINQ